MTLGDRIRYYRERKGWSQSQLGRATGMGQTRLSKIENGRSKPYFWEVERIALYLEVPLGWFDTLRVVQAEEPVRQPMHGWGKGRAAMGPQA